MDWRTIRGVIASGGVLLAAAACGAQAQITADGSLGTLVGRTGSVWSITGGTQFGGGPNLFHSFSRFNIGTGQSATFSGPGSVENIIARVTGPSASSIDGLLRSSIPGASVYLLNPRGVLFGPNAALDVAGSFHVSTADYLKLGTGSSAGRLDASLARTSTLSTSPPSAFGFLGPAIAPISLHGARLFPGAGGTLSLAGGDITLANDAALFVTGGGRVNVASLASAGEVALAGRIQPTGGTLLGSIELRDSVIYAGLLEPPDGPVSDPGAIHVVGGSLVLRNAGIFAENATGSAPGAVVIKLSNALTMVGARARVSTRASGSGDAGSILIDAPSIQLMGGAIVDSSTEGSGSGGSVRVDSRRLFIAGMRAGELSERSGIVSYSELASGAAGTIEVRATELLEISGGGTVSAGSFGFGSGGTVQVTAGAVRLFGGGTIESSAFGFGDAGDVLVRTATLDVGGRSELRPSGILSTVESVNNGRAGSILLDAGEVRIDAGGIIAATNGGNGPGGDITLYAKGIVLAGGGRIDSSSRGTENGGNITVNAASLHVSGADADGARSGVFSSALSLGSGGEIDLTLGSLAMSGGTIASTSTVAGRGGAILIVSGEVHLAAGAEISAASLGSGDAGRIQIDAGERLTMRSGSRISTQAQLGDGGDIAIRATELLQMDHSFITALGLGSGVGGNISIDPQFVVLNHSRIDANSPFGPGGNIRIVSGSTLLSQSAITASGGIEITTVSEQNIAGQLALQVSGFLDYSQRLRDDCTVRAAQTRPSSFIGTGRGGLVRSPGDVATRFPASAAASPIMVASCSQAGSNTRR